MDIFKMMKLAEENSGMIAELPKALENWGRFQEALLAGLRAQSEQLARIELRLAEIHRAVDPNIWPEGLAESVIENSVHDPRNQTGDDDGGRG